MPIDRNLWQKANQKKNNFGSDKKPFISKNAGHVYNKKLNLKHGIKKLNAGQHKPIPFTKYAKHKSSYKHSGDIGDLIYSLPVVMETGGGVMLLNPEGLKTRKCDGTPSGFNLELIRFVQPLLEAQKYISHVNIWKGQTVNIDIDYFRKVNPKVSTLCGKILFTFGVPFSVAVNPWLECEKKQIAKCVVSRSFRYRNKNMDYRNVINDFKGDCVFVGLQHEHQDFETNFGSIPFYKVSNLLEMAEIINGSELFVGNQSSPMSVAIGLNKNIYQECFPGNPDCVFPRSNIQYYK